MTLYWVIAAVLVAIALAFVLTPLLRARPTCTDASRPAANAAVYREQIDELESELRRGSLTQEEFERASREIDRRVVAEHVSDVAPVKTGAQVWVAVTSIAIFIPVFAGIAYWQLGEPRALDPKAVTEVTPQQLEAMVERLSVRLQQTPDDAEGWVMLGRALFLLSKPEPAAQAYARALQIAPAEREILGELLKALAFAGQQKYERGDFAGAIGYWERILRFAPPESELAKAVNDTIAEARTRAGEKSSPSALQGVVSLDSKMKGKASPQDTVFIVARPASGSRMPLAVARTTVAALPYRFTLDDSMAMAAGAKISAHAQVVVAARVSKSGDAKPQKGDLEGASAPVAPGATGVAVVISRIVE